MINVDYLVITVCTILFIVGGHCLKPLGVNNASAVVEKILQDYKDEIGPTGPKGEPVQVKVQVKRRSFILFLIFRKS